MPALLGVTVVAVAAVGIGRLTVPAPSAAKPVTRQPVSWRVMGNHLQTFDATGTLVWDYGFGFDLVGYTERDYLGLPTNKAALRDLDGDGTVETVLSAAGTARTERGLYVFNSDGTGRFIDRPSGTATFGDTVYGPPWLSHRVFVSPEGDRTPAIWSIAIHGVWFPTRLRRLDASGRLVSEYWSNGYIETVHEATWQGRPVLLVGATYNATGGTSLSIFDREEVAGSAPAEDPRYRCRTCPPGGPAAFIVFPATCLERTGGDQAIVIDAWPEVGNRLKALVRHLAWPRPGLKPPSSGDVVYTLDAQYRLVSVDVVKEYLKLHARLEAEGFLDHPFGPDDEREMGQAKRWNGTAFETMGPLAVSR